MPLAPPAFVPLVTSTRRELEDSEAQAAAAASELALNTASAGCSLTPQSRVALGPHGLTLFCLRLQDGLIWNEGCFCFILLYKQKHSPISLLRGLRRKLSQVGVVPIKSVTLPSLPQAWLARSTQADMNTSTFP